MTGIVLIGGKSKRFGKDKVTTPIGDKLLIDHVMDVILPLFDDVILIGHQREDLSSYRIVEDIKPGSGPLGGIYTALTISKTPYCFVFAADMPNLNKNFIAYMISCVKDQDILLPVWSKGREPLHAIYNKRVLPTIESLLKEGVLKIYDLFNLVNTIKISEDKIREFADPQEIFANINTLHDIDKMRYPKTQT